MGNWEMDNNEEALRKRLGVFIMIQIILFFKNN